MSSEPKATRERHIAPHVWGRLEYRHYVLAVLSLAYTISLFDRGLMIILLEPIKQDLSLSDTQIGLLTGLAFAAFYALVGIPIARAADRGNRVLITVGAMSAWAVTLLSFFAIANFVQLLCARVASAAGESGCKPPTYSLIGDYFPEENERATALTVYVAGSAIAVFISVLVGGILNDIYGWRLTFVFFGIPGLLIALLVAMTVRETRTGPANRRKVLQLPIWSVATNIVKQPSSRNLTIAFVLIYLFGAGLSPWYAAFMVRTHAMTTTELGMWLGPTLSCGALLGIVVGGYLSVRLFSGNERGQLRLGAVMVGCTVPFTALFLLAPNKYVAILALFPLYAVYSFFLGPTYAILQRLVPNNVRATALSLILLVANLVGAGLGPMIVGAASDGMQPFVAVESLRYAMLLSTFVALWGAVHLWRVGYTIEADLREIAMAEAISQTPTGAP